jgi:hypothetical protein
MEGSYRGLIEALYTNLTGGTEENYEKPQPVLRWSFETRTTRICFESCRYASFLGQRSNVYKILVGGTACKTATCETGRM